MYIPRYIHKNNTLQALFVAIASLLCGGCSQTDNPDTRSGGVKFGAYVATRAAVSDISTLRQSGFGVFAAITGDEDFSDGNEAGFIANYMYNQKVEWQPSAEGDGGWVYEPVMLWPGKSKVSFFAYAPYSEEGTNGIRSFSDPNRPGSPMLSFSINKDIDRQVDLLYAGAFNMTDSPLVPLTFRHALSRVSVVLKAEEIDSNSSLIITRFSVKSADLATSGDLNLFTGKWENTSGSLEYTTENDADFWKSFFVIPTDETGTIEISVEYSIKTTDSKLSAGSFISKRVATIPYKENFVAGNAYNLNVTVSLNAVSISAELTDWEDESHKWDSDQNKLNKLD